MKLLQYISSFLSVTKDQGVTEAARRAKRVLLRVASKLIRPKWLNFLRVKGVHRPGSVTGELCISVLMSVDNAEPHLLRGAIESVLAQTYKNWELCICYSFSARSDALKILHCYKGTDARIKIIRAEPSFNIAGAINSALEYATGKFVAFQGQHDELGSEAIMRVVEAANNYPDADLLYTDERQDMVGGGHLEVSFKQGWSPELLYSVMTPMHLFVISKKLLLKMGGVRVQFSGVHEYDLALRSSISARQIVHIPKALYTVRRHTDSYRPSFDMKVNDEINARAALENVVKECDPKAEVLDGLIPNTFRVQWSIPKDTCVTLLIPTNAQRADVNDRGNILLIKNLLESVVKKSTWRNYKILVIDNHNLSPLDCAYVASLGGQVVHYSYEGKFNFSKKMNFAFEHVTTEHVIILNDDTEVISEGWIEALLSFSTRDAIGAVGAKLLFPDGNIQHAGITINENAECVHQFYNQRIDINDSSRNSNIINNFPAVTGAAMATRMTLVRMLGGFREELGTDYNDVDYCLRLGEKGYRSVYTPYASLHHFENATLKRTAADTSESRLFRSLWSKKSQSLLVSRARIGNSYNE